MFIHNKYHKKYYQIVDRARQRSLPDHVKFEVHHVIPRSLGGSNDQDNLVKLTLKEHWICHRLLVKFLDDPKALRKMYNALFMMAVKDYRTVNCRIYEQIKESIVPWNKGLKDVTTNLPLSSESKEKLRKLWKGKARPIEHVEAMKKGWQRIKDQGYQPWNKGKNGIYRSGKPVIVVSPEGKEYQYNRLKDACRDLGLTYTHMSSVNSGKKTNWRGWTVKPLNTA
jgi:hypothetical protein